MTGRSSFSAWTVFKDSYGLRKQQDEAKFCFQLKYVFLLDLDQKCFHGNT